jgi:putative membrane protein
MHHGDWGRHGGFHWLGLVWMIVLIVVAGGLVWFGVTLLRRTRQLEAAAPAGASTVPEAAAAARPSAREILDERLARGEIEIDDYHQRLAALNGSAGPATRETPPAS